MKIFGDKFVILMIEKQCLKLKNKILKIKSIEVS